MFSTTFKMFRDLLLYRLELIETVPAALATGDPALGKLILQASEFLDAGELAELYQVVGLDDQQRNRHIDSYTLGVFRAMNT